MLSNPLDQENKSDDLDLMKLLEKLFSFVHLYGRRIAVFSFAGIIAGVILYSVSPRQYESTMLLHSTVLSNTELINIVEDWNSLLKQGEYSVLAEKLQCNAGTLKKVAAITAAEIQKLFVPNNPNGFLIKIIVKDNAVLDSLSAGMVYGFENNIYIKARLTSRRSILAALINKVQTEIGQMDSTKKSIEYDIKNNSARAPASFIIDISSLNNQVIGLNEKLLGYQDELKFANAVQVFHRFEKFDRPVSPKLFKLTVLGFIGGFAIGWLSAVYLLLRKKFSLHMQPLAVSASV